MHAIEGVAHHPVRRDGAEELRVLDLPRQHYFVYPRRLEQPEQLADLAQAQPVDRSSLPVKLGRRFFLDGHDQRVDPLIARRVKHQEREMSVTGDNGVTLLGELSAGLGF